MSIVFSRGCDYFKSKSSEIRKHSVGMVYSKINQPCSKLYYPARLPIENLSTVLAMGITTVVFMSILTMSLLGPASVMRYWFNSFYVTEEVHAPIQEKVISCYYNTPSDNSSAQLQPAGIPPRLCTHLNVGFARLRRGSVLLEPAQRRALRALRRRLPAARLLLSVGGSGEDNGFSDMVINHASRKVFIKSIKKVLKDYNLDGIDLDWEFPVLHYRERGVSGRERQHFSQLLREIRMEYIREKKDYILSVALAAPQTIVDVAYDVDQINLYVDFANIMTYDFHYYTKFTPFTGFNSPLYPKANEGLFLSTLNINYTINMYLSKGLDKNKIVVGIPTYGHSFKLVNPDNPGVGSPASGFGDVGGRGFADYPAVCAFARAHADATRRYDAQARVPFLSRGAEWLSYDDPRSVRDKAAFVKQNDLRGAMIYSLNADDHSGRCADADGGQPAAFPLTRSVADVLRR